MNGNTNPRERNLAQSACVLCGVILAWCYIATLKNHNIYMCELWIAKTRLWILDLERLSYVFQILFCLDKLSPTSMLSLFCRPPPLQELWWLQKDSSIRVTFPFVFRTNLWCAKGKKNGFRIQIWILFKKVSRSTAPYGWWKKSG